MYTGQKLVASVEEDEMEGMLDIGGVCHKFGLYVYFTGKLIEKARIIVGGEIKKIIK